MVSPQGLGTIHSLFEMVFFIGNEPGAKGLPSEVGTIVENPQRGWNLYRK